MSNSMTAYAQSSINTAWGELLCELRSVNHRYLEISPRMPEEIRMLEPQVREAVAAKLKRGKLDCFIRLHEQQENLNGLELNQPVVQQLNNLLEKMQKQIPQVEPIRAIDILRWPGAIKSNEIDVEQMQKLLLDALNKALDLLIDARKKEGEKLADLISQRLRSMREIVGQVEKIVPELAEQYRARLDEKLAEIKEQLEPNRLEQEMVMFLQKTDVAEELDRLRVHIDEVEAILKKPEPVGRRLDFLMQELNREANTLGSKAQDARLTQASIDLKVLIEQIREQVQNIE